MIFLDKIDKENTALNRLFKVPENYFENLTASIFQQLDFEEKEKFSGIKGNTFTAPASYFEGLSAKIFDRIDELETQKISLETLEKVNIFNVPANYFEHLSTETKLQIIDKTSVFKVPTNYFDTLPNQILENEAILPKKTKIIEVNWFRKNIKWVAAASVIFLSGLWFFQNQTSTQNNNLALKNVSKEEITAYLETQDLSYLEYETTTEANKNINKIVNENDLEGLQLDKTDIMNHLESEAVEVKI